MREGRAEQRYRDAQLRASDGAADEEEPPPIHPGEVLLEEFLEPMSVSQYVPRTADPISPLRSLSSQRMGVPRQPLDKDEAFLLS